MTRINIIDTSNLNEQHLITLYREIDSNYILRNKSINE
jgi:hypothetical protein